MFLVSNSLQDFEGYISKRGKEKSASYFFRNKFIDSSTTEKNVKSNNGISLQQNVPFSSTQTIEIARKDIEKENTELENIKKNTPRLNQHNTPQPRNYHRKIDNAHLDTSTSYLDNFLQEETGFFRKELVVY